MPLSLNRRSFLNSTASFCLTALWSMQALGAVKKLPRLSDYPFQLGVASGDPLPDGIVLWTRLAPKPLEGGGMPTANIEVDWEIARDARFQAIAQKGTTLARPELGHSVHVEVGGLEPGREYSYRFRAG